MSNSFFPWRARVALTVMALSGGTDLWAYSAMGGAWPDGTIPMSLSRLSAAPAPAVTLLSDGARSWAAVFEDAMGDWNERMIRTKFTRWDRSGEASRGNGVSDVFFATNIYGVEFGDRTLAVTLIGTNSPLGVRYDEADIIFNSDEEWNSYRGGSYRGTADFRRVAVHELGHAIGLDHPDDDLPAQSVSAIMNSVIGSLETLTADDVAGASALYATPLTAPTITRAFNTSTVNVGDNVLLEVELNGQSAPPVSPLLRYGWYLEPDGGETEYLFTIDRPRLYLGASQVADAGVYTLIVDTPAGYDQTTEARLSVRPVLTSAATRLANLSTRGFAGTGEHALIAGFVIKGDAPKRVLIRAAGPALADFGVQGRLADPRLTLHDVSGQTIHSNDDWSVPTEPGGATSEEMAAVMTEVGAFAFSPGSYDAAVLVTLEPGNYTAQVTGGAIAEGEVIIEIYDADPPGTEGSWLANLSTRGTVGMGTDAMIAGFSVAGEEPRTYLLRAVGDTLAQFDIARPLDDPLLTLFDKDRNYLRELDDWDSPRFLQETLREVMADAGAIPLTDRQESVLKMTLYPGLYTLHLSGYGSSTGIGLVEIYEIEE